MVNLNLSHEESFMKTLLSSLAFLIPCVSLAGEGYTRQVYNGVILYTAKAEGKTDIEAGFLAEAIASRALIVECGIPHREMKVFKKEVSQGEFAYSGNVEVGIEFSYCEEGKKLKGERREQLASRKVVEDQAVYDQYLKAKLGLLSESPDLKTYLAQQFDKIHGTIEDTNEKIEDLKQEIRNKEPETVVIQRDSAPRVVQVGAKQACQAQYDSLMRIANQKAWANGGKGNLAQGEAVLYLNQAEILLANCKQ